MTPRVERRFWLALTASLLLHALAVTSPGWQLPDFDGARKPARLDTRLVPSVAAAQAGLKPSVPVPPPRAAAAPPAPTPEVPQARTDDPPIAPPPAEPPAPPSLPSPAESALASVAPASTFNAVFPRSGLLTFKIVRGDGLWVGQSKHAWRHDGERYQMRAVTETVGLAAMFHSASVVQESSGIILAAGLQPLEFRTIRDGKLREAARIDPAQNMVYLGHGQPVPVSGPVQDVLSSFFQHGAVADDPAEYALTIATGRRVIVYQVSFEGVEKLDTPWGERQVRHLRMYTHSKNDSSEVWLDEITRLPFKIRYRDGKGDVFDQILAEAELEEPK